MLTHGYLQSEIMRYFLNNMRRRYQQDFSSLYSDSLYNKHAKERKVNTMLQILSHYFGDEDFDSMFLLDVGGITWVQ